MYVSVCSFVCPIAFVFVSKVGSVVYEQWSSQQCFRHPFVLNVQVSPSKCPLPMHIPMHQFVSCRVVSCRLVLHFISNINTYIAARQYYYLLILTLSSDISARGTLVNDFRLPMSSSSPTRSSPPTLTPAHAQRARLRQK